MAPNPETDPAGVAPAAEATSEPAKPEPSRESAEPNRSNPPQQIVPPERMIVRSTNPDPTRLPNLAVLERQFGDQVRLLVSINFPVLPAATINGWIYESPADLIGAVALENGGIELRHRWREEPRFVLRTLIIPRPGAVDVVARAEPVEGQSELPAMLHEPQICWQLDQAPEFCSSPEPFSEFIARLFLFTAQGQRFLDQTDRTKALSLPADDPRNNPPRVQMYQSQRGDMQTNETSFAGLSADRFTIPLIGAVSRDKKHMVAVLCPSSNLVAQAWIDCLHNNPHWEPVGAPSATSRLRSVVYLLPNDTTALLEHVARDFPELVLP